MTKTKQKCIICPKKGTPNFTIDGKDAKNPVYWCPDCRKRDGEMIQLQPIEPAREAK